jgi:predicted signal transduction protein with EAL and GGDEF domain
MFGIYLSVIHSPNMRATILLGGFILMPISFIDNFHRIRLVLAFWLVVSTVMAFYLNRQLIIEKETDVLTGLFNRRKLFETLADLETTGAEKPSGILMIDIDNFKDFNDNFGHVAGDKSIATVVRNSWQWHMDTIVKNCCQSRKA